MSELKKCPFCGGYDCEGIDDYGDPVVKCLYLGEAKFEDRPIEDALRSENERLREAIVPWISVEERLPNVITTERWLMYLCECNNPWVTKVIPLWYFGDGVWMTEYHNGSDYSKFVTRWMPLPQPPEVKE